MLDLAIERAINSTKGTKSARLAAIITDRKNVLCIGYNRYKSHPLQAKFSSREGAIYLHAETDAIRKCIAQYGMDSLKGSSLYIARVINDGTPALAKPCAGCWSAIAAFNIAHVEWTVD